MARGYCGTSNNNMPGGATVFHELHACTGMGEGGEDAAETNSVQSWGGVINVQCVGD